MKESQYGYIKCGKLIIDDLLATINKPSKKIKEFETLFHYSNNFREVSFKQSDEFRQWVKQITYTINLLIKNK